MAVGWFSNYNSTARTKIAVIEDDGSLDTGFATASSGFLNQIVDVRVDGDGKYVVGGVFTTYDGSTRRRIARVNTDGSHDTTFDPGEGFDDVVNAIAIQSDGKIVVGGDFRAFDGSVTADRILRLTSTGAED